MTEKEINKLVSDNINYVKSVANHYRGNGVDFDDLVSEGTLAMLTAAQKYDAERGSQFVAYASPFILINKDAQPADDNTAFAQMLNDLERCVGELEERDRIVISKFYGIGMAHETLAEIAEDLQLKRERVRQIRDKAIRQISKNTTSKVLKHFLRK